MRFERAGKEINFVHDNTGVPSIPVQGVQTPKAPPLDQELAPPFR